METNQYIFHKGKWLKFLCNFTKIDVQNMTLKLNVMTKNDYTRKIKTNVKIQENSEKKKVCENKYFVPLFETLKKSSSKPGAVW